MKFIKIFFLFFILIISLITLFLNLQLLLNNKNIFVSLEAKALDFPGQVYESNLISKELPKKADLKQINLTINAESAISIEIAEGKSKILFEKNSQKRLPIASLVKLMTALVVLEKYDLSKKVVIDKSIMAEEGEQGNLKLGEVLSVKNLLYITLIESSNRAAYAISEVVGKDEFVALMNKKAKNLGLLNIYFKDSTGLDAGSYSTVQDIAKLSEYLFLNYPLFREIMGLKEFNLYLDNGLFHHKLINTNKLLGEVPGVILGKTGWTDFAKGCFMVIQDLSLKTGSHKYVIHVVLGAKDRFGEMKKLINYLESVSAERKY